MNNLKKSLLKILQIDLYMKRINIILSLLHLIQIIFLNMKKKFTVRIFQKKKRKKCYMVFKQKLQKKLI
jgi:hypothetical protein